MSFTTETGSLGHQLVLITLSRASSPLPSTLAGLGHCPGHCAFLKPWLLLLFVGGQNWSGNAPVPQWLCCWLVTQSCPTLCDPMDFSTSGSSALHYIPEFAQIHVHWVSDTIQPSHLCHPFLFLPSVFLSIRVFSNESALGIRWPKYWSVSFSICPSSEYSRLISFRIDWLDRFAVQRTLKSLLQCDNLKASVLLSSAFLTVSTLVQSIHSFWSYL